MNNNDVLRKLRYIFALNDNKTCTVFEHGGYAATIDDVTAWLKQDNAHGFKPINDKLLAHFLNGLIIFKRGKKEEESEENSPPPTIEKKLNNNTIFLKLKIACNLKAEEILELMNLADFKMSKHELSAFFRREDHKHYRECKDQILRNFLTGLKSKYRPKT